MAEIKVKITGDASSLKNELKSGGAAVDGFGSSTEKATQQSGGLSSALGGKLPVAAAAAGVAIAYAAKQMIDYTVEASKVAAESERLGNATNSLAMGFGETGKSMVASITEASKGTISEMDAMRIANQAMMFGVAENSDQMGQLTEIAVVLGRAMGQDATKSADDLTLAMGRQSRMILDNLGIIVDVDTANQMYAANMGKTAEQLTEAERKQAFMNAALQAGQEKMLSLGGVINDTQSRTEKFTAASTNFKVAWGSAWNEFGLGAGLTELATGLLEEATYSLQSQTDDASGSVNDYASAQRDSAAALAEVDEGTRKLISSQADFVVRQNENQKKIVELEQATADKKMKILNDLNKSQEELRKRESDQLYKMSLETVSNKEWEVQKVKDSYAAQDKALRDSANQQLSDLQTSNIDKRKDIEASIKDNTILYNLSMMEMNGTLERATDGMAVTAKDAFTLIKADVISVSAAMEKEIPKGADLAEMAVKRRAAEMDRQLKATEDQATKTGGKIATVGLTAEEQKRKAIEQMEIAERRAVQSQGFFARLLYNWGITDAPTTGGGANYASGGAFIIPPGYGGDTFGLGGGNNGSSGEIVTVQPSITNNVTQNNSFAGQGGGPMSFAMLQSMVLN